MPDESNKRMDELLKSYANKRRAEAGEPLEMHPATRKMLQDEVSKLADQTDESESWSDLFRRYRLFVAVAGAFAAVSLLGVTWLVIRSPEPTQMAKNEEQTPPAPLPPRPPAARSVRGTTEDSRAYPLLADANAPAREQSQKKAGEFGMDAETTVQQGQVPQ